MKRNIALLAAVLWAAFLRPADALVISGDQGGRIDRYLGKAARLRHSHEPVIIDGPCNSACTLLVAAVPRARVCVTERASLGFHAAWVFDRDGRQVESRAWTSVLWRRYPATFKAWIERSGGLTPQIKSMGGQDLRALYRPC